MASLRGARIQANYQSVAVVYSSKNILNIYHFPSIYERGRERERQNERMRGQVCGYRGEIMDFQRLLVSIL